MSKKSFKLSEIADFLGGQLVGDASKTVSEIKTLLEADKDSISFIYSKKFKKDLKATIQFDFLDWEKPSLFQWIKKEANISLKEMLSTFNCGVGLIICVEETNTDKALRNLNKDGEVAKVIGKIEKKGRNDQQVEFV